MPAQASTPSWKNVHHPCTSHHEKTSPCHLGLDKSTANCVALAPLTLLQPATTPPRAPHAAGAPTVPRVLADRPTQSAPPHQTSALPAGAAPPLTVFECMA